MKSQHKSVIASWVVPAAILMIAVVIMLYNFASQTSKDAADSVTRNLLKSVQGYRNDFLGELEKLSSAAAPVAALLEKEMFSEETDMAAIAEALCSCTAAYQVVICDRDGYGIDQSNREVSIGDRGYFRQIIRSVNMSYIYAEVDGVEDSVSQKTIVVAERIGKGDEKRFILLFYSLDNFNELMHKSDFDAESFLAVVDSQGEVLGSAGASDSKVLMGNNLLTAIEPDNPQEAQMLKNRLENSTRGNASVTVDGESCVLVLVPLGVNHWEMVLGVSQDYMDRKVSLQWRNIKSMLTYLLISVFVFVGAVVVINIISKIHSNNKKRELEDKADRDLLTGLTNKLATERRIKEYMAQNPESQSMLFMVDVDNFKKINDTMGHAFGDEVLRSLGEQIGALFRASDIIGRVGGDEFMIFLKAIPDKETVRKEAKKVEYFFNNFQVGEYVKYAATASIGVAVFPQEGADFESLYKAADQGVYKAKKRGKNQLAFYSDEWEDGVKDT